MNDVNTVNANTACIIVTSVVSKLIMLVLHYDVIKLNTAITLSQYRS